MVKPAWSEAYTPWHDFTQSTWQMFEDGAHIDLDAPCLTVCHQAADHYANLLPPSRRVRPHECLSWSYREMRHAALVVAKAMADAGVQRGTTIMIPLPNGVETHLVRIVSFILQLTLLSVDADLVEPGRQASLVFVIRSMTPEMVIAPNDNDARVVTEAANKAGHRFQHQFLTHRSKKQGWISWAEIDASAYSDESLEELAESQQKELDKGGNRVAAIVYTSGTSSGHPKGCPQTVRNVVASAANRMAIESDARVYNLWSPASRIIYSCWGFRAIYAGHHVVQTHSHFHPDKAYEMVGRHRIEILIIVPAQVKALAARRDQNWAKYKFLRRIVIGGDCITPDLIQTAEKLWPYAIVTPACGMTEGTGIIGLEGKDTRPPLRTFRSIVTVGKPARGACVRIVDSQDNVVPRGAEGEMMVTGPTMIDHYVNNVQPELFWHDGQRTWIRTGDKAVMDDEGYIFMIGRVKDIIKQSGISLSPAVLENTMNKLEGVHAYAIGVPDPILGEVPVAVIEGVITNRMRSWIKRIVLDGLGQDYALREVYGLAELGMKRFPVNGNGKIEKFAIKDAIVSLERSRLMGQMFHPWFL